MGYNILFPFDQSRKMAMNYDKESDVLYIQYLGESKEVDDSTQIGDYILRFFNNRVIGLTIINAFDHVTKNFVDAPNIFQSKKLVYA